MVAAPRVREDTGEQPAQDVPPPPPSHYIATQPLFIGDQFNRAFNVGDQVPPGHVAAYGWADKVRRPDNDTPAREPETAPGQAISKKSGDA